MPREFNSGDTAPEQRSTLEDLGDREGEIVEVDERALAKDYLDQLAFMEEPVTIRLQPSAEKNAAKTFPVWVNGKPAEVLQRGRWFEIGYLPTGVEFVTKRKYLEPIIRAKIDRIETRIEDANHENRPPRNEVDSFTSPVHSFTVLKDSDKGHAWASELERRYY